MTGVLLALSLLLPGRPDFRAVADTGKAKKPPAPSLAPTTEKPKVPGKAKPVGEPQLKRRKPPALNLSS